MSHVNLMRVRGLPQTIPTPTMRKRRKPKKQKQGESKK